MGYTFVRNGKTTTASLTLTIPELAFNYNQKTATKIINLGPNNAENLLNKLLKLGICDLPDDTKWGTDGRQYVVRISTPTQFRQYSYWSPSYGDSKYGDLLLKMLGMAEECFNEKKEMDKIYKSLPFGIYRMGMSDKINDGFLNDSSFKSTAYRYLEKIMKEKMDIPARRKPFQFPKIIINENSMCLMQELNKYDKEVIKNIKITTAKQIRRKSHDISEHFGIVEITLNATFKPSYLL